MSINGNINLTNTIHNMYKQVCFSRLLKTILSLHLILAGNLFQDLAPNTLKALSPWVTLLVLLIRFMFCQPLPPLPVHAAHMGGFRSKILVQ